MVCSPVLTQDALTTDIACTIAYNACRSGYFGAAGDVSSFHGQRVHQCQWPRNTPLHSLTCFRKPQFIVQNSDRRRCSAKKQGALFWFKCILQTQLGLLTSTHYEGLVEDKARRMADCMCEWCTRIPSSLTGSEMVLLAADQTRV